MSIILRTATGNLNALATVQGMRNAGATILSITVDPRPGISGDRYFTIWAEYQSPTTLENIDRAICEELKKL